MIESDKAWAGRKVAPFPPRWQSRLLGHWEHQRTSHGGDFIAEVAAERAANIELRETVDSLAVVRLPLDAKDSDICREADKLAARASEMQTALGPAPMKTTPLRGYALEWLRTTRHYFGFPVHYTPLEGYALDVLEISRTWAARGEVRATLGRIARNYGIEPPDQGMEDGPALARMADPQWWRRKLRGVHAKHVEGAAIALGYVHKKADPYISNESVQRRAEQNERNAAALEATTATNEDGQEFTLAELAAKGPANKAIRRAELMTRISGFERIARDLGHVGMFFTMTCPSRMHKWKTTGTGQVIENPKYDGTLPNDAQKHLAKTWARIRSALARLGIYQYGFRIAEPNHDGTPHWHILVFLDPRYQGDSARDAVRRFCAVVRRYALGKGADRTERGAKKHRCDFKPIDAGRGSAAGYIAKYVAKNIDGYRLDKDLLGNDAVETSHRVEAWASTWRIRQFQQIGGPPVGPWRELRRVQAVPSNAPAHLIEAHIAVNRITTLKDNPDHELENEDVKAAQWDAYVKAQGGVFCGRNYAIRVETVDREGQNKYGEPLAPVPVGVSTLETFTPEHMTTERTGKPPGFAVRRIIAESARHVWTITKKAVQAIGRVFNGTGAQPMAPWTRVNNCTEQSKDDRENGAAENSRRSERSATGMGGSTWAHQSHGRGLCPAPDGLDYSYQ